MGRAWGAALLLAAATGVLPARPARAADPDERQALLLLRVLAYDRAITARAPTGVITVAVLDDARGSRLGEVLARAAQTFSVAGLPVRVVHLAWADERRLREAVRAQSVTALMASEPAEPAAVARVSRSAGVLTLTESEEAVRGGLAIGLVNRGGRAALLVNLKASRAEGADLDAALLQIAEVQRD